ncbi:hypothetical protein [Streptomyces sp. NPDC090021]|uniref:hypothetical protein n=1 Tax=Streptomyces sp. NPDC090021 TaxID=3365919 RepID=UPI00382AAF9F
MITIDDQIAFIDPECGAVSLLIRIGDLVIAAFYDPFEVDPRAQMLMEFDLPTRDQREDAAKAYMDDKAIGHILQGWDLISA